MKSLMHRRMSSGAWLRDTLELAFFSLTLLFLLSVNTQAQDTVTYYTTDALGSVRMVTDQSGAVIARYDYRPFGDPCGSACNPVPPHTTNQFTGKERDPETGLDYFGARYYASQSGRFTAVDPVLNIDAALTDPQRWNRYTYALNRPLVMVDPDGREAGYVYLPNGRMLSPFDPGFPQSQHPIRDTLGLAAAFVVPLFVREIFTAGATCVLVPSCQSTVIDTLEGAAGGSPRITPTGDIDFAASTLARKLGGQASVAIEGFGRREFDVVSQAFVAQTFGGSSALLKPHNFLNPSRREQIRATLRAANRLGRKAYFEFRDGVHDDVLDFVRRNAERIGVDYEIH